MFIRWCARAVVCCVLLCCAAAGDPLLTLTASAPPGSSSPALSLEWTAPAPSHAPTKVLVMWERCTYTDQQLSCREVGRQLVHGAGRTSWRLSTGLHYDTQYRVCLYTEDACDRRTETCSYVRVPRVKAKHVKDGSMEDPMYLVVGPVYSTNITVTWHDLSTDSGPHTTTATTNHNGNNNDKSDANNDKKKQNDANNDKKKQKSKSNNTNNDNSNANNDKKKQKGKSKGYKVSWRREDGQVGHPGHHATFIHAGHVIHGLIPATRYEVCVRELGAPAAAACDTVHTLEDVPGPPRGEGGSCVTEAPGTHWRCDVTWRPPTRPNGRITGYRLYWRDQEGYTLHEESPPGALCSPVCRSAVVLTFSPSEACVAATTTVGTGWDDCVTIHGDVRSRVVAAVEIRLLWVVAATLLLYIAGPRVIGALLRCCVRGLAKQLDDNKNHVV